MRKFALVCLSGLVLWGLSSYLYTHTERIRATFQYKIQDNPAKTKAKRLLEGKTIVIDPGHGGRDPGSTGQQGTTESDVTLQMAKAVQRELLQRTGATVILTRERDETVSMQQRVDAAKEAEADLFISIHFDAFTTSDVEGVTTYYNKPDDEPIARFVHEHLFRQDFDTRDRGVKFGDYYVLRENTVPALLLELGYISNRKDETRIKSQQFQEKAAKAIVDGIVEAANKL